MLKADPANSVGSQAVSLCKVLVCEKPLLARALGVLHRGMGLTTFDGLKRSPLMRRRGRYIWAIRLYRRCAWAPGAGCGEIDAGCCDRRHCGRWRVGPCSR